MRHLTQSNVVNREKKRFYITLFGCVNTKMLLSEGFAVAVKRDTQ